MSVPAHRVQIRADGPDGSTILSGEIAARGLAGLSPLGSCVCWEDPGNDFRFLRVSDRRLWTYSPRATDPWAVAAARYLWSPDESLVVLMEPPAGGGSGSSMVVLSTD